MVKDFFFLWGEKKSFKRIYKKEYEISCQKWRKQENDENGQFNWTQTDSNDDDDQMIKEH